jgi:hypothetical protein
MSQYFFLSERIALQRKKLEFQVFPTSGVMLSEPIIAIQLKKLLSLFRAEESRGPRNVHQAKSGNFRPSRPESVDVAALATLFDAESRAQNLL